MIFSNYHTHTKYCDGKNTVEEMVLSAIRAGLKRIGLSGHMTLPFPNDWTIREEHLENYLQDITDAQKAYGDQIQIYTGLEIDYFPYLDDISEQSKSILHRLDYYICSLHCVDFFPNSSEMGYYDGDYDNFERVLEELYQRDPKRLVEDYYHRYARMAQKIKPDILGHLDLIKKHNHQYHFFDEESDWYRDLVMETLREIQRSGSILEINTGKIHQFGMAGLYPSLWIINEVINLKIPITVNGDSHDIDHICDGYNTVARYLKLNGCRKIMVFEKDQWIEMPL